MNTECRTLQGNILVYDPLRGVPKMPTASSAHKRRSITKRATYKTILYLVLFTFLIIISIVNPILNRSTAATRKSNKVQFTSSVNCIAIIGMSKRSVTVDPMMIRLFFFKRM